MVDGSVREALRQGRAIVAGRLCGFYVACFPAVFHWPALPVTREQIKELTDGGFLRVSARDDNGKVYIGTEKAKYEPEPEPDEDELESDESEDDTLKPPPAPVDSSTARVFE